MLRPIATAALLLIATSACQQRAKGVTGEPGTNMAAVQPGNSAIGTSAMNEDGNIQERDRARHEAQRQAMGVNAPGVDRVGQGGTAGVAAIPSGAAGSGTSTGVGSRVLSGESETIGAAGASGSGATKQGDRKQR